MPLTHSLEPIEKPPQSPETLQASQDMKLPDNEIRDITKLLEEGKPLPDKYRFMLFGDEREIELVWNGKSQEITNVVLPFQTIEHVDEPRAEESLLIQPGLFDLTSGR